MVKSNGAVRRTLFIRPDSFEQFNAHCGHFHACFDGHLLLTKFSFLTKTSILIQNISFLQFLGNHFFGRVKAVVGKNRQV